MIELPKKLLPGSAVEYPHCISCGEFRAGEEARCQNAHYSGSHVDCGGTHRIIDVKYILEEINLEIARKCSQCPNRDRGPRGVHIATRAG
jgi:hypothetical protein